MPFAGGIAVTRARGSDELVLRPVAAEHLADLEQRHISKCRG